MFDGMEAEARRMQGVAGYHPSIGPLCTVCGEMVLDVWPSLYGDALPVHEHCALALHTERPAVVAAPPSPETRPVARYVGLGWRMVPVWPMRSGKCACGNADCRSPGKHPIGRLAPHGLDNASADPATLKRWKAAVPDLNWAVATGPASGILVIDVDGPVGDQALADLEARHGALPACPWQVTGGGRGGRQLFFAWPAGRSIRNSAGMVGPKIDVRGIAGYCVVPPSVTRERYAWQSPPWGLAAPELPAVWIDLLDPPAPAPAPRPAWSAPSGQQPGRPRYARKAFESELALVACAPNGRRNEQLNAAAHAVFRFVAEGTLSAATATDGLLAAAAHAGLDRREALATISSAAKARGCVVADGEGFDYAAWGRKAEEEMRDRAGGAGVEDAGPGGGVLYILFRDAQPLLASGWLIKGLLPASGLAAIYGPSGCGKTFVAIDMLLHVAAGRPWRGLRAKRTGVLYLSPDGGRAVQNRLAAWRQHHGVTEADFALAPGSVDLLGKIAAGDVEAVLEAIAAIEAAHGFKIGVVAVDTVSRAMPGGDENRPEDMTGFITNVARLHNDGERLGLVIHHTPKSDATVLRGHSSLHGACDCELNVADRAIRVAKQRDGAADAVHGFDLKVIELGHDEAGDAVTSCVAVAADAPEGKERPLSASKQIALNTLRTLIAKAGRELPDGPNYPTKSRGFGHTLGVNLSGFRDEFFNRCEPGQSPDTKSKAFRRALKDLQAIGKVAIYGDWIWCPDKPDKAGQT